MTDAKIRDVGVLELLGEFGKSGAEVSLHFFLVSLCQIIFILLLIDPKPFIELLIGQILFKFIIGLFNKGILLLLSFNLFPKVLFLT